MGVHNDNLGRSSQTTRRSALPKLTGLQTISLPQGKAPPVAPDIASAVSGPLTPSSNMLEGRPLKILVAPSGFKESLGPERVSDAIETGLRRVLPIQGADIRKLPLHDGGEGFCRALVAAHDGRIEDLEVTGPLGQPVKAHIGFVDGGKTAVLDMAAAAGLRLVPRDRRDPTVTTTYGVGELIKVALDAGCTKIIVGCGDSGTSDGGAGMLEALGLRFIDFDGNDFRVADGAHSLFRVHKLHWGNIHPKLYGIAEGTISIEAVCNIKNVLCGPTGVARVYGPQKGATPDQVEILATSLDRWATVAGEELNTDVSSTPGSGASGGLGTGLMLLGAKLRPRSDAISEYFGFDRVFETKWDFVITAEGSLDFQSTQGKMTTEVARLAEQHGAQVVALAGTIGEGADGCYKSGIKAFTGILKGPSSLEKAIAETKSLVEDGAENVIRLILVGLALGSRNE
ncbi:glycerate kinase [Lophiotrema nucula]|uniref:Glycerate kinase n=1 Tax=Lophiotrema nucula TaxID=690887 RepID=A0A6A5ZIR8_9PLEO|nr:glycerate kinase [Lophiotrema nucula]